MKVGSKNVKNFKEKKLKKELETISFSKSFNFENSENYQIDIKETSPLKSNTYIFSAHSFEKRQSLYFRLSITPTQTEANIYYFEGFNKYILEQQVYTTTCPLKIFKEDNKWVVNFSGYLKKNNKDNAKMTFQGKFESQNQAIDMWSNYNRENVFEALKNEKNYKEKIQELLKDDNVYYNQLGVIKGRMILEGQNSLFDLPCIKEHSYGLYDYNNCNNHFNIIISSVDKTLYFQLISKKNMPIFEVGNYYANNNVNVINKAIYEKQILTKNSAPSYLNILLHLSNDNEIGLHIKKIEEVKYEVQEQYDINIAIVEVLMEGKKHRGIIECGYNKNQALWFDGIDVSKL